MFIQLDTTGPPVFSGLRCLSPDRLRKAKAEFDHKLQLRLVRPPTSPWASPLHLFCKGEEDFRPVGDYYRLNVVTTANRYTIPNLQNVSAKLHGCHMFSKVDFIRAYHQIPRNPDDIPKTAICTPFGSF